MAGLGETHTHIAQRRKVEEAQSMMTEPLPPVVVAHPHVELVSGSPFIRGSRVPVRRLWSWFRKGSSVEVILKRYPTLGPARVLDALSFAFDNQALVETDLAREQAALSAEESKALDPSKMSQLGLPFSEK